MNIFKKLISIKRPIIVVVISTAFMMLSVIPLVRICRMFAEPFMAAGLAQLISLGLTGGLLWLLHRKFVPLRLEVDWDQLAYKGCILSLIGVFAAVSIDSGLAAIIRCFGDWAILTQGNVSPEFAGMTSAEKILFLIAAAVMAPIIEEVIFRGILLGSLNRAFGMQSAVVLSSLCFGVLHGTSLVTVLSTALMGMMLAYTYLAYGNLINNILVHGIYNYMALQTAFRLDPQDAQLPDPQLAEILPTSLFMMLGGCALCIIISRKLIRDGRHRLLIDSRNI